MKAAWNAKWFWGAVIVISIGANLVLGAMLTGINLQKHFHPFSVAMKKVKDLPPDQRQAVHLIAKQDMPALRLSNKAARAARESLADYVASPAYNRAEAQRRFDALRAATGQSQLLTETLFLDIADKLTPQQRSALLDAQAK